MTDALPEIVPSISDDGTKGIVFAAGREFTTMADLVAAFPGLRDAPEQMALSINGLAQRLDFDVILDPAAYEAAARARIEREDPALHFRQGAYRLRDFGMPKFSVIHAPAIKGDKLVFYAVQSLTGLPYRVEAGRDGESPAYVPAPLDPLPAPPDGPTDDAVAPVIAVAEPDQDSPEITSP